MQKVNNKGFGAVGILLALVTLTIVGGAGWYVFNKSKDAPETVQSTESDTDLNAEQSNGLITTAIKTSAGLDIGADTTVLFTHPKGWEVYNEIETFELADTQTGNNYKSTKAYILSDKGNYLYVHDVTGVGGSCDDRTDQFTLVKRIPTAEPGIYFSEYSLATRNAYLYLEDLSDRPLLANMKEGDSLENTCEIANSYGFVGVGDLVVTITRDSVDVAYPDRVAYSELSQDPEFIEMLKSLKIAE